MYASVFSYVAGSTIVAPVISKEPLFLAIDHMSMYGVNASVPKTLVRHLVHYYADSCEDAELKAVLYDVLDTPVSPELLPPKDGEIDRHYLCPGSKGAAVAAVCQHDNGKYAAGL